MEPTKEDWDRFAIEIMTGGRSEDMIMEKENEQLQAENTKLKQEKQELIEWLKRNQELLKPFEAEYVIGKKTMIKEVLEKLGE